jgi:LysR family glycine cleavage system transcriptional activator
MKRTHLPLNALRVFDAAARHLSFTRAADELAVTPAAVGQQIRALEDTLGLVLFRRQTRGLELTPEAERALPALREGFRQFEEAIRIMQQGQASNVLTIAAPRALIAKWLASRLAAYKEQAPSASQGLRFVLTALEGQPDFSEANLDLAIHFGTEPTAEGVHGKPLGPEHYILTARPGATADTPRITHPLDPDRPDLETTGPFMGPFMADAGLALDAALAGLGAARVPSLLAAEALSSGALVALSPAEPTTDAWWLTAPTPQWRQAKVRALVAFLLEESAA